MARSTCSDSSVRSAFGPTHGAHGPAEAGPDVRCVCESDATEDRFLFVRSVCLQADRVVRSVRLQPDCVVRILIRGVPASLSTSVATVTGAGADTRLLEAVKAGNGQTVRALLKQRADVNVREVDGTTALHWAARNNDAETAVGVDPRRCHRRRGEPLRRHAALPRRDQRQCGDRRGAAEEWRRCERACCRRGRRW